MNMNDYVDVAERIAQLKELYPEASLQPYNPNKPYDIVTVDFNPTAENMARYLVEEVAVDQLAGTGCVLTECKIEETRKCSATYKI